MLPNNESLNQIDPEIAEAIRLELHRQQDQIELIASENIVSSAVLAAQGSIMTNKYAEGYPARRYYGGCEYVDIAEQLAIERVKKLFNCSFANVQPHSGSQANQAVFLALLKPGDTILGMSLASGGHLTHGSSVNISGKWFRSVSYNVHPETHLIDYDAILKIAEAERPQMIIAGGSAYPRFIDFARMRQIAESVGAFFMVDMAHFAGLVAGGLFPSPIPHAHIVTSTTHKTLRGPRGGIILTNDENLAKKINSAVFPGLQGGPLMHVIAAKAVAFGEALKPEFKTYAANIVTNMKSMGQRLIELGFSLVSGGTDSHLILVDLRKKNITGKAAEAALGLANITCNKNGIPFDDTSPMITSGIRLGSPACTTRGFGVAEFNQIADMIAEVIHTPDEKTTQKIKQQAISLCRQFPIYPHLKVS
ncbi:MAG: serine hydroxymethyltransferase [Alphaproteobacteria bacterium]|nr:serine hydroxymethyltransferase [Alphaproteobacteria bacterium]